MASAEGDAEGERPPEALPARSKVDRRAEALRANLRRRKAQTRARGEARQDDASATLKPGAPHQDD